MRSLMTPQIPGCFTTMAVARPNGPWFDGADASERYCRIETRKSLLANQNDTCGWCQAKVTLASSHSDHILPKGNPAYSHLTFSISNLVASCGSKSCATCGHQKQKEILASWIHPYHSVDLEKSFIFNEVDGEMLPAATLDPTRQTEALDAINRILHLNESVLKTKREKLISDLKGEPYEGLTSDEIFITIGEFKSLIEQFTSQ